jgi:hypothetical protein
MFTRWIDDATVLEGAAGERVPATEDSRGVRRSSWSLRIGRFAIMGLTSLLLGIALLPALALVGLFVIPLSPFGAVLMMVAAAGVRDAAPRTPRSSAPRPRSQTPYWHAAVPRTPAFA